MSAFEIHPSASGSTDLALTDLDVVIPVYNEEKDLADSVRRVHEYLSAWKFSFRITVADNASTDGTALVAHRLTREYDEVRSVHLPEKGRGRALKHVWGGASARVLVYMDVDLSTDLNALIPLVAPLLSGHSDLAIGSRLARGSRIQRGPRREVISRGYNLLLRGTLQTRFRDAQCGFKAIRADVARELLPLVHDDGWFFDTELLVIAERAGLRIHEVPVDWIDDPDSRVDIWRTVQADLRGIARLSWALLRGRVPLAAVSERLGRTTAAGASGSLRAQIVMFVLVGIASTLAYAGVYVAFRSVLAPQWANAAALVVTTLGNTAANRRFTFGVRGRQHAWRHQLQGLTIFALGLVVTSGSLWVLHHGGAPVGGRFTEVLVLTGANLVVTILRFALFRVWVFRGRRSAVAG